MAVPLFLCVTRSFSLIRFLFSCRLLDVGNKIIISSSLFPAVVDRCVVLGGIGDGDEEQVCCGEIYLQGVLYRNQKIIISSSPFVNICRLFIGCFGGGL